MAKPWAFPTQETLPSIYVSWSQVPLPQLLARACFLSLCSIHISMFLSLSLSLWCTSLRIKGAGFDKYRTAAKQLWVMDSPPHIP